MIKRLVTTARTVWEVAIGLGTGVGIATLVVGVVVFGLGRLLHAVTGHDFDVLDTWVTLVGGPALLCVVVVGYWVVLGGRADLRMRRQMRAAGRFRPWGDLRPHLSNGVGTLIVELLSCGSVYWVPWRLWWTPDDVLALAPSATPESGPFCHSGEQPFVDWCIERYLQRDVGTAVLTRSRIQANPDVMMFPERLDEVAIPLRQAFPALSIIVLPMAERAGRVPPAVT